jgi:hypothetical protein
VLKVIIQLGNLVKEADWDALHALLETLSTGVLVEVVMANMAYLPAREDIMSSDTPSSSGALSGLMEVCLSTAVMRVHGDVFPDALCFA